MKCSYCNRDMQISRQEKNLTEWKCVNKFSFCYENKIVVDKGKEREYELFELEKRKVEALEKIAKLLSNLK